MTSKGTDSDHLKATQYKTPNNLNARQRLHELYSVRDDDTPDLFAWIVEHLVNVTPTRANVLEVGCGPGTLWPKAKAVELLPDEWTLTLTDLSDGMVAAAEKALTEAGVNAKFQTATVEDLPFEDNSFDLVVGNYMLYHVPDLPKGIREIRRVLKPGAAFFGMTNGADHMIDLVHLVREVLPGKGYATRGSDHLLKFRLENGAEILGVQFDDVREYRYGERLRVDAAQPLIDYVLSSQSFYDETYNDAEVERLRDHIQSRLDRDGMIEIRKSTGGFVAR
jgi:ubiquinone/menaquinone biosynthesis C-methylase UbiE